MRSTHNRALSFYVELREKLVSHCRDATCVCVCVCVCVRGEKVYQRILALSRSSYIFCGNFDEEQRLG